MELGLYSFGEVADSTATSAAQRMRELLAEIELADEVGLDVFGVGEHHRADFAISAPTVVLAAAAARTKQIRLTSAVEVIEKIIFQHELFGHQRFLAQVSVGPLPHAKVLRAIELLGTVVAPAVRKALGHSSNISATSVA